MARALLCLALLLTVSCAGRTTCPVVDEDRLVDALTRELLARAEANRDAPEDPEEEEYDDEDYDDEEEEDDDEVLRHDVPVEGRPARGPADALVTIVVFADFECPFSRRAQATLRDLDTRFQGSLRVVFRHLPLAFHVHARDAAEAAEEAYAQGGEAKFWQMHDLLFQTEGELTQAVLERHARTLRLNLPRFRRALREKTHEATIAADETLAEQVGAQGTPNFFVNGVQIVGAQPVDVFAARIEAELSIAEELVRDGTPRVAVYDTLMAEGRRARALAPPTPAAPAVRPGTPDPARTYRVPLGDSPSRGPDDALVTIVQFSDFQCPFCARVEPTLSQLVDHYGGDLRIVFRNNPLPFHAAAMPSAEAAREAYVQRGSAGFWAMHALLFAHQTALEADDLRGHARQAGLDLERFDAAMRDHRHRAAIELDQGVARSFGAGGTPAFFVNGRFLSGAQPYERFAALVDEALAEARARVAAGTPHAYEAIVAEGLGEVLPAPPPPPAAPEFYDVPLPRAPIAEGPADAPLVLQIFTDFQCPFCSRLEPTIDALQERYGARIRVVWRDYPLPFHQNAMLAAEAAREIFRQRGLPAYLRFHETLFRNQQALFRDDLERYAGAMQGIDLARLRRALDTHEHRAAIQEDVDLIARLGITGFGTPTIFVGRRRFSGAQTFETFVTAIDAALAGPRNP